MPKIPGRGYWRQALLVAAAITALTGPPVFRANATGGAVVQNDLAATLSAAQRTATDAGKAYQGDGVDAQLQHVLMHLKALVGRVNGLAANLKQALAAKPRDMKRSVNKAASMLSAASDATAPDAEWSGTVKELLHTAQTHLKTVTNAPEGTFTPNDKKRILAAWRSTVTKCEQVLSALTNVHMEMHESIQQLEMHQNAMAELLLADQYNVALNSILEWVAELKATAGQLNNIVNGGANS